MLEILYNLWDWKRLNNYILPKISQLKICIAIKILIFIGLLSWVKTFFNNENFH